jgi:hypothetical protein
MSRAALELERAVKEMRAKSAKERAGAKPARTQAERPLREAEVHEAENTSENQLTGDTESVKTDHTNLSQQEEAAGGNDAAGENGNAEGKKTPNMAKKNGNGNGAAKKAKAPKAPKAAKAPKAPKGERKPREKKVASGKLKKIEASGTTYLTLEFEEGTITLTPTGNREQNRDVAVKALRGLL